MGTVKYIMPIAAIFGLSTPTIASEDVGDQVMAIVHSADLDLATARGQSRLRRRIIIASHEICGWYGVWSAERRNQIRCFDEAIGSTKDRVAMLIKVAQLRQ